MWGDDERFVQTYFTSFRDRLVYSTFDWGIRDEDGYHYILGRTDDVINVAGHRLGTREIEEAVQAHPNIAEVAVVGVADAVKGQMPLAFAVVKDAAQDRHGRGARGARAGSDGHGGPAARRDRRGPSRVHFVSLLPEDALGQAPAPLASRRSPKAATPAISRRSRIRRRWSRSVKRWARALAKSFNTKSRRHEELKMRFRPLTA